MMETAFTVSQVNEYVRLSLSTDPVLHGIELIGEISNFKCYSSGHWYFTLKDEEAAIGCVMFRQYAVTVPFCPENGEKVRLKGSVSLYSKTGTYQFYTDGMTREGTGELYLQFEKLKHKLLEEGLFDESRKKSLPALPKGIGIVTSRTGAVVHDIAKVAWRRYPGIPLYLCSVKVQGTEAAQEIVHGIQMLDSFDAVDLLIIGRGGGSLEDLWPFNEEIVARAIYACRKPVVSAVGHETDYTIADFTADVRASTPSHAAEITVPLKATLLEDIEHLQFSMDNAWNFAIRQKRNQLLLLNERIKAKTPAHMHTQMLSDISAAKKRIETAKKNILLSKRNELSSLRQKIEIASPKSTLKRGYAIVTFQGKAVRNADELDIGQTVSVQFSVGNSHMTVQDKQSDKDCGKDGKRC